MIDTIHSDVCSWESQSGDLAIVIDFYMFNTSIFQITPSINFEYTDEIFRKYLSKLENMIENVT